MSDSDSDDTFVVVGTPLKPYEEDEPVKKHYDIQNQKVKDSHGRQRFHGAFTGGFSAGYFNTVGSKEGWTPSTFVSSRGSRAESGHQRPEDFMDEEDLGEYGIAPRVIKATEEFRSGQQQTSKRPLVSDGLIPGEAPLASLIKPASLTMGMRLLRKLGWREGQGVGPRIRRKKKHKPQDGKKVYGCSLPGFEHDQTSSSEEEMPHVTAANLTFAPKDVCPIDFKPKDNLFGLGYSGLTIGKKTGHIQLFEEPSGVMGKKGKQGIRGQAFGVGALEEDDDDIYAADKLSNYDRVLGDTDTTGTYGWTAPTNKGGTHKDYVDTVLEGFKLMSTQLKPRKVYPPPLLPRDFKPYHIFTDEENATTRMAQEIPKKFSMSWKKMNVADRREALGEKPDIKSVFDLVNEKDKQHMKSCQTTESPAASSSSETSEQIQKAKAVLLAGITSRFQSAGTEVVSSTGEKIPTSSNIITPKEKTPLCKASTAFKPFASDPEKQARYEKYLDAQTSGNTGDYERSTSHMTEWERSHEKEEFGRASRLYRPMSSLMASRFTEAKFKDDDKVIVNKEQGGDVSDQAEAAKMKMYGRLTHDMLEWHPDKLLCKRFNVPNPYPDSNVVGLPKVKRDKFSIFNFLSIPGEEPSGTDQSLSLAQSNEEAMEPAEGKGGRKKKLGQQGKPLAILASVDLRQPVQKPKVKEVSQDQMAKNDDGAETKVDESEATSSILSSRPPPDIFKAVFGDSDPEESSSEEEDNIEDSVEEKSTDASFGPVKTGNVSLNQTQHSINDACNQHPEQSTNNKVMPSMEVYDTFGVKIDLPKSGLLRGLDASEPDIQSVSVISSDNDLCDAYGPPLPPGVGNVNTQDKSRFSPTTQSEHRKMKKHKEKEKHKGKHKEKHKEKHKHKKKSKNKKHREKKKKKKKEVIVISTPSGSEADSEVSSSNDEDTHEYFTKIISKAVK